MAYGMKYRRGASLSRAVAKRDARLKAARGLARWARSAKHRSSALVVTPMSGARSVPSTVELFPNKRRCTLRYADSINVSLAPDYGTNQIISGNNLVKPDVTSTGHQPRGYDQAMSYYQNFTVIGSRVRWTYVPSTAGGSVMIGAQVDPSATDAPSCATVANFLEILGPNMKFTTNTDGSKGIVDVYTSGLSSQMSVAGATDGANTGQASVAPSLVWYHRCYLYNRHLSATTTGVLFWQCEYDCIFSEPLTVGVST